MSDDFIQRLNDLIAGEVSQPEPGSILDLVKRGETTPMTKDAFMEMAATVREANERAPVCHGFLAHHSVPWGRLYRQWDTKGRLWCWVNKGWIFDQKQGKAKPRPFSLDRISDIYTIPVIDVHAVNSRLQFGESDG